MGNESSKSAKEYSTEIDNSLMNDILPWSCISCKTSNHSNPKFCDKCRVPNPVLSPPSFINDTLSSKPKQKNDDNDNKNNDDQKVDDKSKEECKFKQSLLSINDIQSKVNKYFKVNKYENSDIVKPLILPVIHIKYSSDENYLETIDFNISLVKKYNFSGIWLIDHKIDHNFDEETYLVKTIKMVRKKYPNLWIGANFLGVSGDSLVPFLIKNELIINHNTKTDTTKMENILNGLWVDNGGIRIIKEYEKEKGDNDDNDDNEENKDKEDYSGKYEYGLAALRALQFNHYKIRDFLYFGGIDFKYQGQVHKTNDIDSYRKEISLLAAFSSSGFMDIVCTSGKGTGQSIDVDKIKAFRKGTENRSCVAIASGVTPKNIVKYIGYTDFILVATGISADFHTFDENKMKQLKDAIDSWKPNNNDSK